jgi:hypothetical protein
MVNTYASYADIKAICPFIDQILTGTDEFYVQRLAANIWIDNAVRTAAGRLHRLPVVVCPRIVRACAYKAASEILMTQITPMQSDNAYEHMAAKFQRVAENELSTLVVRTRCEDGTTEHIDLSFRRRGEHG